MKKNLFSFAFLALLVGLVSMTSCKKEETQGNSTQFRATMEGCTSQDGKTVLNGTALEWVSSDQIAVYGTAGCGIYSATPQTPATTAVFDNVSGETGNGPFRAFYPTTLTTDGMNITLPATQTYVEGSIHEFPMYAESSDNQLAFKNLCGVLKLNLTKANTNISSIHITAASEINGTFSVAYNSGDPELTYSANGTNTTTLTCATPQSISEGKDFYIYLPEGSYSGLQIMMITDDNRYCVKTANTAVSVTRSQYTLITLGEEDMNFSQFVVGGNPNEWFTLTNHTDLLAGTSDGGASTLQNIGFTLLYDGVTYTQFSVNTDGNLKLGEPVTGVSHYTSPFSSFNVSIDSPKINFFGADGYHTTGTHYVYAQNAIDANNDILLVVEFCLGTYSGLHRNTQFKWQVHMYPNGTVIVVYPSTVPTEFPINRQPGLCSTNGKGWVVRADNSTTFFTNGTTFNAGSTWPAANTYYEFDCSSINE